jgi:hypothetical protein
MQVYHNYIRSHEGLDGKTSARSLEVGKNIRWKKNLPSRKIRGSGCSTAIAEIYYRIYILTTVLFPDRAGFTNATSVMI